MYNVPLPIVRGLLFAHWVHDLFEEVYHILISTIIT
jgi:hypothetical protein